MADGLYRSFTYLGAKLLEELFLSIAMTLVFSSYVFYGVQLQGQWVVFWLVSRVSPRPATRAPPALPAPLHPPAPHSSALRACPMLLTHPGPLHPFPRLLTIP